MKIGILTYHCVPNFGAQLQTISTIGYLKRLGHEPVVIHWYPQDLEDKYSKNIPANQMLIQMQFAERNMPLTRLCRTEDDVVNEIDRLRIDAVFAGSDALFKYIPQSKRIVFSKKKLRFVHTKTLSVENIDGNVFWGKFLSKTKRPLKAVAFSVSSQNTPFRDINDSEKQSIMSAMEHYSKITTRDEWTKEMVHFITGQENVDITPDPVFAFNQNCYLKIPTKEEIIKKFLLPENYVLISFLRNIVKKNYIHEISHDLECNGMTPIAFPMPNGLLDFNLKCKISLPLSPIDWYALIKYSRGYIGERMHPIVVCLHNAIPFFAFDEYGTFKKFWGGLRKRYIPVSSKTYHILDKAGLTDWMYSYFNEKTSMPTCSFVIKKILEFPVSKCQLFASTQQEVYNSSMQDIMQSLM